MLAFDKAVTINVLVSLGGREVSEGQVCWERAGQGSCRLELCTWEPWRREEGSWEHPVRRMSRITQANIPSWSSTLSTPGFCTPLGNAQEEQCPGRDAPGELGPCLGHNSAGDA